MKVFYEKGYDRWAKRNGFYVSTESTDERFWYANSLEELATKLPYRKIEFIEQIDKMREV